MFKVRPGAIDLGSDYQYKIVVLLCIRVLAKDMQNMQIAIDVSDYYGFDDIVLHVQTPTRKITYMMEISHRAQPKPVVKREFSEEKGNFSIKRSLDCVAKIKERMKSKSIDEFDQLGNIYFVHFTNRSIQRHRFLERIDDQALAILDTNPDGASAYKYNYETLLAHQLITNSTQPALAKDIYLLCEQVSGPFLDRKILNELESWLNTLGVARDNFTGIPGVAAKFTQFIFQWARGLMGGHYYLTKHDIVSKLTELCLYNYTSSFMGDLYVGSVDRSVLQIWKDIMDSKAFTLVESDRTVSKFLHQYIAGEVRKYCSLPNLSWWSTLSEDDTVTFFKKFEYLKSTIFRFVGNHGKITLKDLYTCMWLVNQLPLLLEVSSSHCHKAINGILKISNHGFKVVIIKNNFPWLETRDRFSTDFATLEDLSDTDKERILNRHGKLQGRPAVIRTFIDESIYKYITATDVILILADNFKVGSVPKSLPRYHIQRSLSRVLLTSNVLKEAAEEIFLVEAAEIVSKEFESPNLVTCCSKEEMLKQIDKFKSETKVIHRVSVYDDSYLEWKESFGDIRTIRNFIKKDDHCWVTTEDILDSSMQNIKIISSKSGMGKSTLLDSIALDAPTNMWILRINLHKHQAYYKNSNNTNVKACDHLRYFNGELEDTKVILDQLVFCKFLESKTVFVLLDGFDDVPFIYQNELLKITKSLVDDGYNVWLASSPERQIKLENELNTISSILQPFSENDCIYFLKKYLSPIGSIVTSYSESLSFRQSITKKFVDKLLELVKINLQEEYGEFIKLPFHAKLLGKVFYDEYKTSLSNYVVTFNDDNFDLLYLYDKFINDQNRFIATFTEGMRNFFEKRQELLALKVLFGDYFLQILDGIQYLDEVYPEGQNKIQFELKQGFVVVEQNGRSKKHEFDRIVPHRIFAELLAAKWLRKNYNSKDTKLRKITRILTRYRSKECHSFLFRIFDLMEADNKLVAKYI